MKKSNIRYFEIYVGQELVYSYKHMKKSWDAYQEIVYNNNNKRVTFIMVDKLHKKQYPMNQSVNGNIFTVELDGTLHPAWMTGKKYNYKYLPV